MTMEIGATSPDLDFRRWVREGVRENNKGKNDEERQRKTKGKGRER